MKANKDKYCQQGNRPAAVMTKKEAEIVREIKESFCVAGYDVLSAHVFKEMSDYTTDYTPECLLEA